MSYIGKNPEVDSVKLKGSATQASGTEEGQLYYNTGTGSISKGLKVFKNSQFVAIDKQLGDADTFHLLKAADISTAEWDAARNSTSTSFLNQNAVPFETTTASGVAGTFSNSSTGDALLTDESADLVFAYKSSGTSDDAQEYFGIPLTVPKAFRGGNVVLTFEYRTGFGTGTTATVNGDFEVAVLDKSSGNGGQTTSTNSTTDITAGSAITVASKTGLAVGQRIRLEAGSQSSIGHPDATVVEAFITSVSSTANEITISEDWDTPHASGAVVVSGWLTDIVPGQLKAADSQTNKQGKKFSIQFKTEDDTSDIVLFFQNKNTSSTISRHLFVDNILLSANKFLQASSRTKSADYNVAQITSAMSDIQGGVAFNLSTASISEGSGFSDIIQVSTGGTGTGIYTKFEALVDCVVNASCTLVDNASSSAAAIVKGAVGNQPLVMGSGPVDNSHKLGASCGIVLKKGEEFHFEMRTSNEGLDPGDPGAMFSGTTACYAQIVATPEVADTIILESQEEIFTDYVDYTPTITGHGTVTNLTAQYRRVGTNIEFFGSYTTGTVSTDLVSITLPPGLNISTSVAAISAGPQLGRFTSNETILNSRYLYFQPGETDKVYITEQSAARAPTTRLQGSQASTSTTICDFWGSIPIQGYNTNFNPLLSMPLQDFSSLENTFSARLTNNGSTSTITSQSGNFIASVSRTGSNGGISVTFTPGFFSEIPSVVVTCDGATGNKFASVSAISTSGCTINADEDGGSNPNQNMNLTVTRQGGDFRQAPQATAAVIKPAVCEFSMQLSSNTSGGDSTAGAWNQLKPNTFKGETWFVSGFNGTTGVGGTNTDFDLDPGTYSLECTSQAYSAGTAMLKLISGTTVFAYGQTQFTNSTTGDAANTSLFTTFTITAKTTFTIKMHTSASQAPNGLGHAAGISGVPETYLAGFIHKLK